MFAVLGESERGAERLKFTLGEEVVTFSAVSELRHWIDDHVDADLVVVGPDVSLDVALKLSESYRAIRPALGIILQRRRLDVAVLGEAMRAGIREVISSEDAESLVKACRRSREISEKLMLSDRSEGTSARGKVILVFSAKGGCGKTTVSTNLAQALSTTGGRVCLVDFDLEFGDVAVALRIPPKKSITDAVPMQGKIDQQGLESVVLEYRPDFDVLLAPVSPADAEQIDNRLAEEVVLQLRQMYDYVVIDSPPAFTEVILKSFDIADNYVMLTTLDMPALKNLKVSLEMIEKLGYPREKWVIVVNRSDAQVGLSLDDVEATIGFKIHTLIPSSSAVPASVNRGQTLVLSNPKHPVSVGIMRLAEDLRTDSGTVREKRRGFLRR